MISIKIYPLKASIIFKTVIRDILWQNLIYYLLSKEIFLSPLDHLNHTEELGSDEETIIKLISEEKSRGIIRQISPIFDTKRLGYSSSLVSFKVKYENIDRAVKAINSHPGVSHNYEREHPFNIWFTLAVPPNSKLWTWWDRKNLGKGGECHRLYHPANPQNV